MPIMDRILRSARIAASDTPVSNDRQAPPSLARRGKTVCPQCGRRTFVDYLYPDGSPVASGVCGKCDRADHCGHHCPPREYFRANPGSAPRHSEASFSAGIMKRIVRVTAPASTPAPKPVVPLDAEPSFIPSQRVEETLRDYDHNVLAGYLAGIFSGALSAAEVAQCFRECGVGTDEHGNVIYWQLDRDRRVRTGKVMAYDPDTGCRLKGSPPRWAHSSTGHDFNLCQTLFGAHLLGEAEKAFAVENERRRARNLAKRRSKTPFLTPTIWLFESEKAALVAQLYLRATGQGHNFVAMATGGCEGFNPAEHTMALPYGRLAPLKDQRVVLFPDEGKYDLWAERGRRLKGYCAEVWISTLMERKVHPTRVACDINRGDGPDDVLMRYIQSGRIDLIDTRLCLYGFKGRGRLV